jgi:hypothetical protein
VAYKQAGDVDSSLAQQVEELLAMEDSAVPVGDDAKYVKGDKNLEEPAAGYAWNVPEVFVKSICCPQLGMSTFLSQSIGWSCPMMGMLHRMPIAM